MAIRLAPLVAAIVPIAAVLSGCWSLPVTPEIATHELPSRNPTSWVFDAPRPEVRAAIRERLRSFGTPEATTFAYGFALYLSDREDLWGQSVLREPGNEQDFVLRNIGDPFGVTETVRGDGRPLDIQGWYHLHLRSIGPERTSVTVTAHDVKVIIGMTSGFRPHGPAYVYLPIEGTTIEEYSMLLEIGEALGTEGMPPMIRPE